MHDIKFIPGSAMLWFSLVVAMIPVTGGIFSSDLYVHVAGCGGQQMTLGDCWEAGQWCQANHFKIGHIPNLKFGPFQALWNSASKDLMRVAGTQIF